MTDVAVEFDTDGNLAARVISRGGLLVRVAADGTETVIDRSAPAWGSLTVEPVPFRTVEIVQDGDVVAFAFDPSSSVEVRDRYGRTVGFIAADDSFPTHQTPVISGGAVVGYARTEGATP